MEIKLPELGEGVNTAKVVDILVSDGDTIKEGDDVIEVETDKAVAGVPASSGGKVTAIKVSKGDEVSVGQVLVEIDSEGGGESSGDADADQEDGKEESEDKAGPEDSSDKKEEESGEPDEEESGKSDEEDEGQEESDEEKSKEEEEKESGQEEERDQEEKKDSKKKEKKDSRKESGIGPPARPELRRMARELGIDLARVRGTERGGRISAADIRSYVKKLQEKVFDSGPPGGPHEDLSRFGPIESEELPAIRKTISNRLLTRWRNTPLVTQFGEADLSAVMKLKEKHAEEFESRETRLTLSAFFIMALVPLLQKYPKFNASLDLEAEKIIHRRYLHFGIAVATEKGLLVPVIRDVQDKSMLEVAKVLETASAKAREGKLERKDMEGAGFYISNQGAIGGGHFTPLLSGSESAILGIGRGRRQVVESEDGFKAIPVVPLALSYDHRLIDGAEAATFMKELEDGLAGFDASLLEASGKD